jgi:hypothetical protein
MSARSDQKPFSEDDCSKRRKKDRWARRQMIDALPLSEEPICDEWCLLSFLTRLANHNHITGH